jgi:hypothetical protein
MAEQDKKPPAPGVAADGPKKKWNNRRRRPYLGNRPDHTGNKPAAQPVTFRGGKDELDGNYFDCTGYGQSDRFMKTVQKIADYIGQEYKGGGVTRTEVMTQVAITIPTPTRPTSTSVTSSDGTVTSLPPDVLDISDYQSAKKIVDYKVQCQTDNRQKVFSLVWQQCTESMHAKIRAHRDYHTIEQALNVMELNGNSSRASKLVLLCSITVVSKQE